MYVQQRDFNGMGQFSGQFGAAGDSPDALDLQAGSKEAEARALLVGATTSQQATIRAGTGYTTLMRDAMTMRTSAANIRREDKRTADRDANIAIIGGTAAKMGDKYAEMTLANKQALDLAKLKVKEAQAAAQGGGGTTYVTQTSPLSTTAMIGLGAGALVLVGVLVMVMGKK